MKTEYKRYETMVANSTITIETGKLAMQAGGAVTVRLGDTMMFAAVTMSSDVREGIDFFPLTVDYEERMYAGGQIPGSFFRREGRPTEEAILTARLTDRPLRPLFPKDLRNDVQVILYAFSTDGENPIDVIGINAASTALMISDIPWGGPIAAVRVGRIDGEFVINPTFAQLENSDLDLRMAGTRDAILMVECGANEVSEEDMLRALELGHQSMQPLIDIQEKMAAEIGKPKREYTSFAPDEELQSRVYEQVKNRLVQILEQPYEKSERYTAIDALRDEIVAAVAAEDETKANEAKQAFDEAYKKIVRQRILDQGIRPDNRTLTEVRPIWCEVGISPRAHGSGLFTRGETQVLTVATLGTRRDAQELDNL
ncbi:MAG: polyribonucleotide nucleotidyltransferase, partial [Chloroflexi bacterium]